MTSPPSGDADNLDDVYAEAERKVRAALAADRNDLSDQVADTLASMADRIDDVTSAIDAKTWPDYPRS